MLVTYQFIGIDHLIHGKKLFPDQTYTRTLRSVLIVTSDRSTSPSGLITPEIRMQIPVGLP